MSTQLLAANSGMDPAAISAELKAAIIYRTENRGAVKRIAELMGLTDATVYDYLEGRIKPSLLFLHACVIATGDPDAKKFLEPRGFRLVADDNEPATRDMEREIGDVDLAVANIRLLVRRAQEDGRISAVEKARIKRAVEDARIELNQCETLLERIAMNKGAA